MPLALGRLEILDGLREPVHPAEILATRELLVAVLGLLQEVVTIL